MRHLLFGRLLLGLVLLGGLSATSLTAQPPGPGKGPKGKPDPMSEAESRTMTGTVRSFTTAPKGEIDGAVLDDGTVIHWPPHLADRFKDVVTKGDRVKATGRMETGPEGDTHLEVLTLTNMRTKATVENDAPPPPPPGGPRGAGRDRPADPERRIQALEDRVDRLQKEIERLKRER